MALVLVLMGLLLAVTLPHLGGTRHFAAGQRAQATATGALDTAVHLYTSAGVRDGGTCNETATPTHAQMDPGPYPPADPATDPTAWTNCPVFANPADLAETNGDVRYVPGDQPTTGDTVASVAAAHTPTGWRIAVAVLTPDKDGSGTTCWMSWRQAPDAGGGESLERYFTLDGTDAAAHCTGNAALVQQTSSECENPTAFGGTGDPLGMSWRRPCPSRTTT